MISVILPCHNINDDLVALTASTIDSLGEVNLIVIDNDSSVGGGFLRHKADIYVRNKENLGYAKAVNQGLSLAKTDLIAISNNDIRVSPNWQSVAEEVFITDTIYSCHFKMTDYDSLFEYGAKIAWTGKERWCTSSFFVINTKKVKFYYDENYLNSYDDWDYWRSVRLAGFKTAYTDKAVYQHNHSYTQKLIPEREENNKKNREYFKEKWGEYAEDLFTQEYPDQMKVDYLEGFKL